MLWVSRQRCLKQPPSSHTLDAHAQDSHGTRVAQPRLCNLQARRSFYELHKRDPSRPSMQHDHKQFSAHTLAPTYLIYRHSFSQMHDACNRRRMPFLLCITKFEGLIAWGSEHTFPFQLLAGGWAHNPTPACRAVLLCHTHPEYVAHARWKLESPAGAQSSGSQVRIVLHTHVPKITATCTPSIPPPVLASRLT